MCSCSVRSGEFVYIHSPSPEAYSDTTVNHDDMQSRRCCSVRVSCYILSTLLLTHPETVPSDPMHHPDQFSIDMALLLCLLTFFLSFVLLSLHCFVFSFFSLSTIDHLIELPLRICQPPTPPLIPLLLLVLVALWLVVQVFVWKRRILN